MHPVHQERSALLKLIALSFLPAAPLVISPQLRHSFINTPLPVFEDLGVLNRCCEHFAEASLNGVRCQIVPLAGNASDVLRLRRNDAELPRSPIGPSAREIHAPEELRIHPLVFMPALQFSGISWIGGQMDLCVAAGRQPAKLVVRLIPHPSRKR